MKLQNKSVVKKMGMLAVQQTIGLLRVDMPKHLPSQTLFT
jgi:hypothetical protein